MLIDTSVWLEFFAKKTALRQQQKERLRRLVEDGLATTVQPIVAELASGAAPASFFALFVPSITSVDPDWNAREVWQRTAELGQLAHRQGMRMPGLVDRMIVVAAERAHEPLWTLDADCRKIARVAGIAVEPA